MAGLTPLPRLRGSEIPLTARILQTVDIYDALTTKRPYRKALLPKEALRILREEVQKGWWDGALVDHLENLLASSPPASTTPEPLGANRSSSIPPEA